MSDSKDWRQYAAGMVSRLSSRSRTEFFMPGSTTPELLRRSEEALREGVEVSLEQTDRISALEADLAKERAENARLREHIATAHRQIIEGKRPCARDTLAAALR